MNEFEIAGRTIGPQEHCLIVGEVAQTHDGSLSTAHAFIDAIADAGADAVKFQVRIAAESARESLPIGIRKGGLANVSQRQACDLVAGFARRCIYEGD